MRFEYVPFGARAPAGAAACDGLVEGARLDLSHWSHNRTPAHLKRDTSAEIALAFAAERTNHDVSVAANNHFDTDGALAIWALLSPEPALAHRDLVISAAECGDFDEWPKDERGIWLEAAITRLAGIHGESAAYARVVPELDALVPSIGAREDLWGEAARELEEMGRSIAEGRAGVEKVGRVAVYRHAPGVRELAGPWISRLRPPGTDRVLLAFAEDSGRFRYRYELPRHAWADTVTRPRLAVPKRGPIRRALGGAWIIKGRKGMTGLAYTAGAVQGTPDAVARALCDADPEGAPRPDR